MTKGYVRFAPTNVAREVEQPMAFRRVPCSISVDG